MITLQTKGLLDGQFTKLWKDLYIMTSNKQFRTKLPYPKEMKPYLDDLYGTFSLEYEFIENKFPIDVKNVHCDIHDNRVVCAFSGGKDSVANVLVLKDLGYEPILFFTKGINRSYPQELEHVKKLSKILNMKLYIYDLKVSGKCDFYENPTKDQFILALMIDYGLKQNIPNYSFGTYIGGEFSDSANNNKANYMLSDGTFMFKNALKFYQSFIPEIDFPIHLANEEDAWFEICKRDTSLLLETYSCMTPLRYKKNLVLGAEKKYGIKLLPNRCPSCYKCCTEAILLNDYGVVDYPDEFLEHCKEIVYKFYEKYKPKEWLEGFNERAWSSEDNVKEIQAISKHRKGFKLKW